MMILTQTRQVDTGRLLGWLAEVLKRSDAVSVKIGRADNFDEGLSLQITLPAVPAPPAASGPEHDEKQLDIFHDVGYHRGAGLTDPGRDLVSDADGRLSDPFDLFGQAIEETGSR